MGRDTQTPELALAFREAKTVTKSYGTSYYTSTLFFPKETRDAVFALYGLARKADEIVDSARPEDMADALVQLDAFEQSWRAAYATGQSQDPILYAAAWVFRTYDIPLSYAEDFFSAMRADTHTRRYATYADLETYMYGSATVIGLMIARVIGTKSEEADVYAGDLGYAMQLTNFLRDVREDYEDRDRIYLPQEDLDRFGVTEAMIANRAVTSEFKALMAFEIARARSLYASADEGIPLLARSGRKPVQLARVLYSKILDRIEDADYDVFSKRRYTTRMQKLWYALPILIRL